MQLYMVKIGARPAGRLIEQHDVMFIAADSLPKIIPLVDKHWAQVKGKWHLDAWRTVTRVGNYRVSLERADNRPLLSADAPKLYFINLGGYLAGHFEEFHYKTLCVADSLPKATAQAKQTAFYRDYNVESHEPLDALSGQATSHVDDKHGIEVDDIHSVQTLLPDFAITLTPLTAEECQQMPEDTLHIGYISLKQLKAMPT